VLALYMAVFALFSVPHLSIGTELTRDPKGQTAVMGWRQAFSGIGLLIGSAVAPILVQSRGGGVEGYGFMAIVLAIAVTVTLLLSFFGSAEPRRETAQHSSGNWAAIWANKPFLILFIVVLLNLASSGLTYATFAYLFTFKLGFAEPLKMLGISVLIIAIGVVIAQPLWVTLSNRIGKPAVFMIATAGYIVAIAAFLLTPSGNAPYVYAVSLAMGVANAGCYTASLSMLSDCIEQDARATGQSRSGFYSALWIANDKIAFALGGALLAGFVLQLFGFQAGAQTQSAQALTGIAFAYAGLPAILNTAAIALMAFAYRPAARLNSAAQPQPL
jgi:glycoside/pentoside/hexuronide:cation symporter, GPH family